MGLAGVARTIHADTHARRVDVILPWEMHTHNTYSIGALSICPDIVTHSRFSQSFAMDGECFEDAAMLMTQQQQQKMRIDNTTRTCALRALSLCRIKCFYSFLAPTPLGRSDGPHAYRYVPSHSPRIIVKSILKFMSCSCLCITS